MLLLLFRALSSFLGGARDAQRVQIELTIGVLRILVSCVCVCVCVCVVFADDDVFVRLDAASGDERW
jgi:hypothetical protein